MSGVLNVSYNIFSVVWMSYSSASQVYWLSFTSFWPLFIFLFFSFFSSLEEVCFFYFFLCQYNLMIFSSTVVSAPILITLGFMTLITQNYLRGAVSINKSKTGCFYDAGWFRRGWRRRWLHPPHEILILCTLDHAPYQTILHKYLPPHKTIKLFIRQVYPPNHRTPC